MQDTLNHIFLLAFVSSAITLRFARGNREFSIMEVLIDAFYGFVGSGGAIIVAYAATQLGADLNNLNNVVLVCLALFVILNVKDVRKRF